ncbi:MAG TPA: efflux RND transporter periplasmic adaptor subunit [Blastocatellia bacterium]|nr:efflux RND transporter periplasmic adaptor subunit [Blastocatellia bacterium]
MTKRNVLIGVAVVLVAVVLVFVFSRSKSKATAQAAAPVEVEVAQVEQKDVPIYSEWIGTLDGLVNAEIKSQVTGYLLSKNYTEGSFVKKGQLLFEIDPRPFQAALDQAKGELAKSNGQLAQATSQLLQAKAQLVQAEANQAKTQNDVDRYTPLAKQQAVTQQDLDNAVHANQAALAQVKAAEAAVETAKASIVAAKATVQSSEATVRTNELNVGFTKITSLIDGVAGVATVQVGNLVSSSNGPPLTIVSTVDPIRVWFNVTEQEYLNNIEHNPTHPQSAEKNLQLDLVLADGTTYQHKGRFYIADRNMDLKTGSIKLAGVFPNPGNLLRPGQYGRVRAVTSLKSNALLVPQRAVSELQGSYRVAVVGNDNKVSIRPVKVGEKVDSMWIIEDGLKPGESVVAEGIQRIRPDQVVSPKPYQGGANGQS